MMSTSLLKMMVKFAAVFLVCVTTCNAFAPSYNYHHHDQRDVTNGFIRRTRRTNAPSLLSSSLSSLSSVNTIPRSSTLLRSRSSNDNDDDVKSDGSGWMASFLKSSTDTTQVQEIPVSSTAATANDDINNNPVLAAVENTLSPAQEYLDEVSGGWALSYADLSPESSSTVLGQTFLATNIAYAVTGIYLSMQGELLLGALTEIASIASFIYHYTQLEAGMGKVKDRSVRLALMVDYVFAFSAIIVANVYLILDPSVIPIDGIASAAVGLACLFSCWIWEAGTPYIILHSLWHLFSAYAGYAVGSAHVM